MSLKVDIQNEGAATLVVFSGSIDEDANLKRVLSDLSDRPALALDVGGVERINSCGVREWVNFMRALDSVDSIELRNCPPSFVGQLNMISNFGGASTIRSVQAPYLCDKCGHDEYVVVKVEGVPPSVDSRPCPKCGTEMAFDDLEDSYFAFLR